jgi:hypothetical protein
MNTRRNHVQEDLFFRSCGCVLAWPRTLQPANCMRRGRAQAVGGRSSALRQPHIQYDSPPTLAAEVSLGFPFFCAQFRGQYWNVGSQRQPWAETRRTRAGTTYVLGVAIAVPCAQERIFPTTGSKGDVTPLFDAVLFTYRM